MRYNLMMRALVPVLFAYFLLRSLREPDYRRDWGERLGFVQATAAADIWLHAASVGEVQAAVPLLRALLQQYPQCRLHVTCFTPTGAQRVQALALPGLQYSYLPVDTPAAVRRFLQRVQPKVGVIVEAEYWPNLLCACAERGIPVLYASARLSPRSLASLRKHLPAPLLQQATAAIHWAGAQSPADAQRLQALGVDAARVEVTGNLKFDQPVNPDIAAHGAALRQQWGAPARQVWIAASTHEGEEQAVLQAHRQLCEQHPQLLLILVPRHPQRFERVYKLIRQSALAPARRSRGDSVDADTEVLLGDTLGELPQLYAAADVAFVGGSLTPIGGHNLLEAAAVEVPMVVGPHTQAQQAMVAALKAEGGLREISSREQLAGSIHALLSQPQLAREQAAAARQVLQRNRGALARTLEQLAHYLHKGDALASGSS